MPRFNVDSVTVLNVYNLVLTLPNTEYFLDIGQVIRKISIQCRESVDIKFSMTSGAIAAGLYQTIKAGTEKFLEGVYLKDTTVLYFETTDGGSPTVEIEVWK
jgi:hypothetical protein